MNEANTLPIAVPRWSALVTGAVWSAPAAALLLGLYGLRVAEADRIGPLGLVTALNPEVYAALALLTAGFVTGLYRSRPAPTALLVAHVMVFAVLLFGAATIVEPLPRGVPAWLHVGFADYIARTGQTLPDLDARFSWPGFFALAAMGTRLAGMRDAMPLLGWTPAVLNLLYAALVFRLARATSADTRTAWLAVWLFLPANWVGQDYFGPQALNFLFYLAVLTVLLVWFRPARTRPPRPPSRAWARLLHAVGLPARPLLLEPRSRPPDGAAPVGLIALVLVVFAASTASHQLTPIAITASATALVLAGRCRTRALPLLMIVVIAAYISYLTVPYWSGHLQDMFGSFGRVGGTVEGAAVQRVDGDPAHRGVVLVRLAVALSVWCLAGLGIWRRLRRGHGDLALFALAGAPFLLIAAQNYGGEILLRVYAFGLPFMAILLAGLFAPAWLTRQRIVAGVAAGLLSAALTGAFLVARYGNEGFERVRPADREAVQWLYAHATPGSSLIAVTSNVPWRSQDVERYRFQTMGDAAVAGGAVPAIEKRMRANAAGAYLILTKGQYVFAESFLGQPPGWGARLEREVAASDRFRLVYANPEARVYVLAAPGTGTGGPHE